MCVWIVIYVCRMVQDAESNVASAACDIQDFPTGLGCAGGVGARVYAADKVVFPEAVDAEGHEVVHCVVRGGDGAEDCTDCWEEPLAGARDRGREYLIPFDSFNDSAMLSKPKCVVFSLLGFCSARFGEDEKARRGRGVTVRVESRNRFAARGTNEDMVDVC